MNRKGYAPWGSSLAERLALGTDQRGPEECWPWTKATDRDGYGCFGRRIPGGKTIMYRAHVVAFELANGSPAKDHVLHRCNNPICCNPAHLYDGPPAQNAVDRWSSGRGRCQAVLTAEAVTEMRERFKERPATMQEQAELAALHDVTPKSIENALKYRTWKKLQ